MPPDPAEALSLLAKDSERAVGELRDPAQQAAEPGLRRWRAACAPALVGILLVAVATATLGGLPPAAAAAAWSKERPLGAGLPGPPEEESGEAAARFAGLFARRGQGVRDWRLRGPAAEVELDGADVYASFVTSDDSYLPGIQALAMSLLDAGATRPLIVLVTGSPSLALRRTAACLNFSIFEVPHIANPYIGDLNRTSVHLSSRYENVFGKLHVFALPARRVVYLDADVIVLKNIDELFAPGPPFRAAPDCGFQCPSNLSEVGFNSGVMVIDRSNTSNGTFRDMQAKLALLDSYDGGDQGFLQSYFAGAWQGPAVLNSTFNTLKRRETTEPGFDLDRVSVIHNVGEKPWTYTADNWAYPQSHGAFLSEYISFGRWCGVPSFDYVCILKRLQRVRMDPRPDT